MLHEYDDAVTCVAFAPHSMTLAVGTCSGTIEIWDLAKFHPRSPPIRLGGHSNEVTRLAFKPDGNILVSGSEDGTLRFWDATTSKMVLSAKKHKDWIGSLAFDSTGKKLASASIDDTVALWDVSDIGHGRLVKIGEIQGKDRDVSGVWLSPRMTNFWRREVGMA